MDKHRSLAELSHMNPRKGRKLLLPVNGFQQRAKLLSKKPAAHGLWLVWATVDGTLYVSGPEGMVRPYRQWLRRQKEIEGLV